MTDRELLEKAAKAAGLQYDPTVKARHGLLVSDPALGKCQSETVPWNPLTDDGDALRLAVKLRLVVEVGAEATLVYRDDPGICELHEADAFAATRRAIVRAAAALAGD